MSLLPPVFLPIGETPGVDQDPGLNQRCWVRLERGGSVVRMHFVASQTSLFIGTQELASSRFYWWACLVGAIMGFVLFSVLPLWGYP